jgi:hypothetical protein
MAWKPGKKELEEVFKLPVESRYKYLIKKAADTEVVWSLWEAKGWALASDSSATEAVPVWPHELFALQCATGPWLGYQPKTIPLAEWLERWFRFV